jgi:osmotically inducible protein OsmC
MTARKVIYSASATVRGGREGTVSSDDGRLRLDLSVPMEVGGTGGPGTNPEQLFAAGYAACFQSALGLAGRRQKVDTSASVVTGTVGLSPNGAGGFQLAVTLTIALAGVDRDVAHQLIEQAHQVCPYSNAIRGNVDVQLLLADA